MPMDIVDEELAAAERDASPGRYQRRASNEIERVLSASSGTSSTSSRGGGGGGAGRNMSRVSTQNDLERHPTELSRIATARSQHNSTNWPMRKKVLTAAMLGYTTLTAAFTSSIFSSATTIVADEYGVGSEVGLLGTTFYVLGFAFGPTLWAPMSELRGRRLPIVISMFGFSLFSIACATGKDIQTILICRFFSGFFGACPLAVVAAVFSDMFDNRTRGIAVALFSMSTFTGPLLAPFIGGFIVTSHLGWRWTEYLATIMGFVAFFLDLFFLEETYPPVILIDKAADLRRRTKNWGIHAKQEEIEVDFVELVQKNFSRPLRLLFTEPIILLLSVYMSFIYGILYLFLTAYPLVFIGVHGFTPGQSGLTFFGMICGQLIAGVAVIAQQPWYNRKLAGNNGIPVPEWRMPSMMAGGIAFAVGIFWFGWTGFTRDIHWAVPAVSGIFTGFGLMSIFLQALNYLVDAYLMFAASAIAGNTFMRSLAGAGFPLFARQMFEGMGIQWASTLLGCIAVVLAPIPFVFYIYGGKIRARSAYAPTFAAPAMDESSEESTAEKDNADSAALASSPPKESDNGATQTV
ncbi:major facilitator superfamily [Moelleriella libera RCEF 2490]|uniref:Major facilitator superfamily n=1 Tax=Moelleriella libera RCEF 2490 TaxID=1081109 RepID=A0A166P800_9HYPO|nr:major facilitator superfamily [Moelleriella libera RCEF 2490]